MTARIWILTNSALTAIQGDSTANGVVDVAGNTVYCIDNLAGVDGKTTTSPLLTLSNAKMIRTLSVKDYQTIGHVSDPVSGADPFWAQGFRAMLYDDENWIPSPGYQQANPGPWYAQAAVQIKGRNYGSVAAPARDLANVLVHQSVDAPFIAMNVLASAARANYDVIDVQAQYDQPGTSPYPLPATTFNGFVDQCFAQIKAANPAARYTVGLRVQGTDAAPFTNLQTMTAACAQYAVTGSDGHGVTGGVGGASGFWMNFNGNNPAGIAAVQALAGI